jgi:hypothetical protein
MKINLQATKKFIKIKYYSQTKLLMNYKSLMKSILALNKLKIMSMNNYKTQKVLVLTINFFKIKYCAVKAMRIVEFSVIKMIKWR